MTNEQTTQPGVLTLVESVDNRPEFRSMLYGPIIHGATWNEVHNMVQDLWVQQGVNCVLGFSKMLGQYVGVRTKKWKLEHVNQLLRINPKAMEIDAGLGSSRARTRYANAMSVIERGTPEEPPVLGPNAFHIDSYVKAVVSYGFVRIVSNHKKPENDQDYTCKMVLTADGLRELWAALDSSDIIGADLYSRQRLEQLQAQEAKEVIGMPVDFEGMYWREEVYCGQ